MEEEIIVPEEEVFAYDKLRYILDKNSYVCHASLGGLIVCDLGECTEYNGEVPSGYSTIEEWYDREIEKLNAWKIVEGNLVYDENRYSEIQKRCEKEEEENTPSTHKWTREQLKKTSEVIVDEFSNNATGSSLVVLENSGDYEIPKITMQSLGTETQVTGTNVTLENSRGDNVLGLKIDGNYYQETRSGKNLFNVFTDNYYRSGANRELIDNGVRIKATSTAAYSHVSFRISNSELLGQTVTLSGEMVASSTNRPRMFLAFVDDNNVFVANIGQIRESGFATFTIPTTLPSGATGVGLLLYENRDEAGVIDEYVDYTNVQLEIGSVVTEYEKFGAMPSPDYPSEVEVVEGYNLASKEQIQSYIEGVWNSDGRYNTSEYIDIIDVDGREVFKFHSGSGYGATNYSEVRQIFKGIFKENTQYNIAFDFYKSTVDRNLNINVLYTDGTSATFMYATTVEVNQVYSYSFTTAKDKTVFAIRTNYNSGDTCIYLDTLQITEGSEQKAYLPYQNIGIKNVGGNSEQITPLDLKGEFIGKLPNGVQDYLTVDNQGNYGIQKNVGKRVLNGSESININNYALTTYNEYVFSINISDMIKVSNNTNMLCDKLVATGWITIKDADYIMSSQGLALIHLKDQTITTVDAFKTWLSENNVTVYYELAEPYFVPLGQTIIPTFEGVNNISLLSNLETELTIDYLKDHTASPVNTVVSNKNLLGIDAVTETINGVTITVNEDKTIKLNGTSTEDIEFTLKGTSTNIDMLFLIQKNTSYTTSGLVDGVSLNLYSYDGTDRALVGGYTNEVINIDEPYLITQTTLSIPKGKTFKNVTIKPMLEIGDSSTLYTEHQENTYQLTFDKFDKSSNQTIENKLSSYSSTSIVMFDKYVGASIDYFKYKSMEEKFAEIEVTEETIKSQVQTTTEKLNELGEYVDTIEKTVLEQTNKSFTMWFEDTGLQNDLNNVKDALNGNTESLNTITEYIHFEGAEITLGKSDSQTRLVIKNDRISFMTGDTESAYISENTLYITDSTILNKMQVGHWETKEDDYGNFNTKWVGDI